MADMPNVPGAPQGATPMKKSTGKVQPKKETVRINLPPKPSAAPTIKLPTLPPGGPTGVPSMAPPSHAAPPAAAPAARPAPVATAAPAPKTAMPRPTAPTAVAAPRPQTISTGDKILAIAALIAVLAAVGTTAYMAFMF
jgi:hypothetical protein